jgi:hypothetical protein
MEVRARLVSLGEGQLLGKILPATWNKVTGKPRTAVPTRVNTESEEQFQELLAGLVERAERWWETEGYDKHSQGVLL